MYKIKHEQSGRISVYNNNTIVIDFSGELWLRIVNSRVNFIVGGVVLLDIHRKEIESVEKNGQITQAQDLSDNDLIGLLSPKMAVATSTATSTTTETLIPATDNPDNPSLYGTSYTGWVGSDSSWRIVQVITATNGTSTSTTARNTNNPTYSTALSAWANRTTLNYA